MSLAIVKFIGKIENNDNFHISRILILLKHLGGKNNKELDGITKLVKLDFLLRYPKCLEKVAKELNFDLIESALNKNELQNIESKMIRYKYGPWDSRYRRWIGILVAKDLVKTYARGRTVYLRLTEIGLNISEKLIKTNVFNPLCFRSDLISRMVGKYSGTKLKNLIYQLFPEIVGLKFGKEITL